MSLLDFEALQLAPLSREPFTFTVVQNAIRPADAAAIRDDFPEIEDCGLLPVEATHHGPLFRRLIEELKSEETARAPARHAAALTEEAAGSGASASAPVPPAPAMQPTTSPPP